MNHVMLQKIGLANLGLNTLLIVATIHTILHAQWAELGIALILLIPLFLLTAVAGIIISILGLRRAKTSKQGRALPACFMGYHGLQIAGIVFLAGSIFIPRN